LRGWVFDLDSFAVHDGPGIRLAVYLKGCPMSCKWCHSPESQKTSPEIVMYRDRCILCGRCASVCPSSAHSIDTRKDGSAVHHISRDACSGCGSCVRVCPAEALAIKGYRLSADRIIARAMRMRPFFEPSGGGITLSGGEPAMQADFCAAVMAGCRDRGIHTAVETSGMAASAEFRKLVEHADLVLFDVKIMDEEEHQRWTGGSNRPILANAAALDPERVQLRLPLIPGITDTDANVDAVVDFAGRHGFSRIALLPYNLSAPAKYEWLDRAYEMDPLPADHLRTRKERIFELRERFVADGITAEEVV
jgi:pyruvate formate lyase activating enzyme